MKKFLWNTADFVLNLIPGRVWVYLMYLTRNVREPGTGKTYAEKYGNED